KCMLLRMLPLASRTSTTERGVFSAAGPETSRKYETSCRTPSSYTSMSLGPSPRTNRPALSWTTAVTDTTSTSTSRVNGRIDGDGGGDGEGEGVGEGACARRAAEHRSAPATAATARGRITWRRRGAAGAAGRGDERRGRPRRGS